MYFANNPIYNERMKHIEVDYHLIQDMVMAKWIVTSYVTSGAHLGDIFTKVLFRRPFRLCTKLGMIEINALAWGVLEY